MQVDVSRLCRAVQLAHPLSSETGIPSPSTSDSFALPPVTHPSFRRAQTALCRSTLLANPRGGNHRAPTSKQPCGGRQPRFCPQIRSRSCHLSMASQCQRCQLCGYLHLNLQVPECRCNPRAGSATHTRRGKLQGGLCDRLRLPRILVMTGWVM